MTFQCDTDEFWSTPPRNKWRRHCLTGSGNNVLFPRMFIFICLFSLALKLPGSWTQKLIIFQITFWSCCCSCCYLLYSHGASYRGFSLFHIFLMGFGDAPEFIQNAFLHFLWRCTPAPVLAGAIEWSCANFSPLHFCLLLELWQLNVDFYLRYFPS